MWMNWIYPFIIWISINKTLIWLHKPQNELTGSNMIAIHVKQKWVLYLPTQSNTFDIVAKNLDASRMLSNKILTRLMQ